MLEDIFEVVVWLTIIDFHYGCTSRQIEINFKDFTNGFWITFTWIKSKEAFTLDAQSQFFSLKPLAKGVPILVSKLFLWRSHFYFYSFTMDQYTFPFNKICLKFYLRITIQKDQLINFGRYFLDIFLRDQLRYFLQNI